MKTKLVLTVFLTSLLFFGCSDYVENVQQSKIASKSYGNNGSSEIHRKYPKEQKEVLETFGAIATSINNGAGHGYYGEFMDQLISFHAYGDKFVEFNGGQIFDSVGNEHNERQLFGEDLEEDGVIQFAALPGTLKVAVYYGNVANLTFTSDFILMHKTYGEITVNNLITLLFVKTNNEWKLVHEHHSNVADENNAEESGSASIASESNSFVIDEEYPDSQAEVLETFGAIATSITNGAGHGYDGEYMDELISYHAYGDKFTEFNGGQSFDSAGNEHNERQLFGEDLEIDGVLQFAPIDGTLKVAVFHENVANLTFASDFRLMHKTYGEITINNLITLLFVKTNGGWKIAHEHHSPINQ
ncbi:MAG: SnoaL-like domain-containing protein [Flavobacteriaceae bacterium]|nr:SnoaL-like domain-containing protein [Flavobacteriaceae bacterium]